MVPEFSGFCALGFSNFYLAGVKDFRVEKEQPANEQKMVHCHVQFCCNKINKIKTGIILFKLNGQ